MSVDAKTYEFPNCMHVLNVAFHMEAIDPGRVEISLPFDDWFKLYSMLERRFRGLMIFDGRGETPKSFTYLGFKFACR